MICEVFAWLGFVEFCWLDFVDYIQQVLIVNGQQEFSSLWLKND
jgi:hypothetical protein